MKFILSSLLVFLCVFAKAQVPPPMVLGGPQGIDVTRLLARNWMSTPIYTDTPSSPLTGAGWPGRGYLITVVRNETACQSCPPKDTTLWMYTGARWKRVGYDYLTRLVYGGTVSKVSGQNLRYLIQPYGAFFDGDYKIGATAKTATLTSKSLDSTSRIDVLVLNRDSFQVKTGIPTRIPQKPLVTGSEVEIASFYFKPFDSIPAVTIGQPSITNIFRVPGVDSIYYSVNTQIFAIKDSIGITKNDTAAMLNNYKFTAANGLTKDSTVFRLGGSLNQNTNINLNTRRLSFIGGSDTTRFFSNGRVSIGGTPDSTYRLNVNGTGRFTNDLFLNSGRVIYGTGSNEASLVIEKASQIGTTPGVYIGGANTFTTSQFEGNYLLGDRNSLTGRTISTVSIGFDNDIDSSSLGIVLGSDNNIENPTIRHILIGNGNIGNSPSGTENASIVIGKENNTNKFWGSGLIGSNLKYYENGQLAFGANAGGSDFSTKNVYFGNGVKVENKTVNNRYGDGPDVIINPSWANNDTTNRNGGSLTIAGGRGTGTGTPGTVRFSTWNATTSGSTLHPTLTERARISPTGNLLVGRTVDSIYRLDVNGDARVVGAIYQRFGTDSTGFSRSESINILTQGQTPQSRNGIFIGSGTYNNTNSSSIGIGRNITVGIGNNNVAIGAGATASRGGIAISSVNSGANTTIADNYSISIGGGSNSNTGGVSIGNSSNSNDGVAIGVESAAGGVGSVAVGPFAVASGNLATSIGSGANSSHENSIAIGRAAITTEPKQLVIGGHGGNNSYGINNVFIGSGVRGALNSPGVNVTYNGSGAGTGNSLAGGNVTIAGGKGTGNGTPGAIIFSTSTRLPNAADTTTLQTLTERARISERGNLLVGTSTDDTSSLVNIVSTTKGFLQPRMTNTQRDAITTPATGLQLFNTTDSANYVYRGGGGWQKIANEISGSAELNFPSTNNGNKSDLTITVTGAAEGDVVSLGIPNSVNLNHSCFTAWVSNANEVTVRFNNYGTGALDPVLATFKVKVFK